MDPNNISTYDLKLRIHQIFDLLEDGYGEIYLYHEAEPYDLDHIVVTKIDKEEFEHLMYEDLIKLANWYNIAYNYYMKDKDGTIPSIVLSTGRAKIFTDNDDIEGNEIAITKEIFEKFMTVFPTQRLVFDDEDTPFRNVTIPRYGDTYSDLMVATMKGDTKIVKLLLETGESNPGAQDNDGKTALIVATMKEHTQIVKLLLKTEESNPGAQDNDGKTALMVATMKEHTQIVKLLLETEKSNPGAQDNDGKTALIMAVLRRRLPLVKLLLETEKSNPGAQDNDGNTVLMIATMKGYTKIVKILLETGESNPGAQNNEGETALILAATNEEASEKYVEIAKILIETGESNPGAQDNAGYTALMVSVIRETVETIKLLLETGESNPGAQNNDGDTALMFANNREDIINLIKIAIFKEIFNRDKLLPGPKKGPYWMFLCNTLDKSTGLKQIQEMATDLGIDIKNKSKRKLCSELAKDYESLLKADTVSYDHNLTCHDEETDVLGNEWKDMPPEDIFTDIHDWCLSYDDLEALSKQDDLLHPYTRVPLESVKLKNGKNLLEAFEERKKTRISDDLKIRKDIHLEVEGSWRERLLQTKLGALLDENPEVNTRNYFEVDNLDKLQGKSKGENLNFINAVRNAEIVQKNEQYLPDLFKYKGQRGTTFEKLLELLIYSINNMPQEDRVPFKHLLIGMVADM